MAEGSELSQPRRGPRALLRGFSAKVVAELILKKTKGDKAALGRHYRQKEQQVLRPRGPEQPDMLEEPPGVQSVVGGGQGR